MIKIIQSGNRYNIQFKYDPQLIQLIKSIPSREYHPDRKMWSIDKSKLGWLLRILKGTKYEQLCKIYSNEDLDKNATLDSTKQIPDIDISDAEFRVKSGASPYAHQLDFMKFAIARQRNGDTNGFILADEQGLGKTIQAMNLALYNRKNYKHKHCLIICCINTSKYNWYEDIKLHTSGEEEPYILGTRFKRDKVTTRSNTGGKEKLKDLQIGHMYGKKTAPELPYFLIVNIEAFRAKSGKAYTFTDEIVKWINDGRIGMIILDEIHRNASPSSLQGKQLLQVKKRTGSKVLWLPMTGTPIVNKPTDVYLPLKLIEGHTISSYYMWQSEFCVFGGYGDHQIIGYKNIPRLKAMLQYNMLRRLKSEVLDLPPKIRYTEYVENTLTQKQLYVAEARNLLANRDQVIGSMNPLVKFLRLRQINGSPEIVDPTIEVNKSYLSKNAKLQRVLELLEDAANRGEKTVIFSNWVEPLRTLYRFISPKYKVCCYTGTMSSADREKHKNMFITNPEYTVLIGTVKALGTSHTLTVAKNVIFFDEPWTATDKHQAEDRLHRIGATEPINIFTIITKDTVDDKVHDIIENKHQVSKYIVDNKLDIRQNPELFDLLLGDT